MKYRGFLKPDHPECRAYSLKRAELMGLNRPRSVWGWRDQEGVVWFYDPFEARRVIDWIERFCRHRKGEWAGKPIELAPWQKRIIREIFGWYGADGYRKHRVAWIEIPRKNGKSTLMSAVALYLFVGDDEPAAEVYTLAGSEEQARIVYQDAMAMVEMDPALDRIIEAHKRGMVHGRSDSICRPLGKGHQHGLNPHGGICDEIHEWKGRDQFEAITTAAGTRRQPLLLFITTAGADLQSLWGEQHRIAKMVKDGILYRPDMFVAMFAADPSDDWESLETWHKANPGLRHGAPKLTYLQDMHRQAKQSAAARDSFKRLHLNICTGGYTGWIPSHEWLACSDVIDWRKLKGARCYAGMDIAKVNDLSALVLLFPPDNPAFPGRWVLACKFWCPEEDISERGKEDGIDYKSWQERGLLKATPGNTTDFDVIENDIIELADYFNFVGLGGDPFLLHQMAQHLAEAGIDYMEVRQGILTLGPPTAELQRLVRAQEIKHGGHEIMGWNIANTVVQPDSAGNIKPHKGKSGKKIDGTAAAINALAVAMASDECGPALDGFLSNPATNLGAVA